LNGLDLLGDSAQNAFFQSIEFVKTAPGSHLTYSQENPSHGLEIESVIATEDENKAAKLPAQCFDRLSFTFC
jgi:hypothetical protein